MLDSPNTDWRQQDTDWRQHDTTQTIGCARSFERQLEPNRRMSLHGTALVDNLVSRSKMLAEEVIKKTFKLLVTISQMDEEDELKQYEC